MVQNVECSQNSNICFYFNHNLPSTIIREAVRIVWLLDFQLPVQTWWGVVDTTLCDKDCQWLATGLWFFPVSSTNKTDCHDITEILLKVALKTIYLNLLLLNTYMKLLSEAEYIRNRKDSSIPGSKVHVTATYRPCFSRCFRKIDRWFLNTVDVIIVCWLRSCILYCLFSSTWKNNKTRHNL